MAKKKSDYWLITVNRTVRLKVTFVKKLTKEKALETYELMSYDDILDECVTAEDVVGIAPVDE